MKTNQISNLNAMKWWQKAVFYQIYPRSFADSNGDGISDFPGMTDKLDYLKDLGIDGIWLSPHYPSPFIDCGYDVADYTGVGPEYGTMADFKHFLDEAHRRDMRVILDMVYNHTSDQHPWFIESRSSRDNPKRDWYVWKDGKGDGPPNNWDSFFGSSAWEFDAATGQYYYHAFLKEQPDLNWRNPQVQQAVFDATRFWLELGVDGYRLDAINTIYEHPDYPDHTSPFNLFELGMRSMQERPDQHEQEEDFWEKAGDLWKYQISQEGVHQLMRELRLLVDEYPEAFLVGETDEIEFYGNGSDELHMAFNFPLMRTNRLTPKWVRDNQRERLTALPAGAWPCNTLGNHDNSRLLSKFGDGVHDPQIARLAIALMLTLKGTPFLYNGEEIGMTDLLIGEYDQFRDLMVRIPYETMVYQFGMPEKDAVAILSHQSRDRCRTPMQWQNAPNAGFCPENVQPWLPVNPNYAEGVNVAEQLQDPGSLLNFYKRILQMRKETPALIVGEYQPVNEQAEDYLAFLRKDPEGGQTCLVVLNFSDKSLEVAFDLAARRARLVFSSDPLRSEPDTLDRLGLSPFEILVLEVF
jgi:alpha-glucosidase